MNNIRPEQGESVVIGLLEVSAKELQLARLEDGAESESSTTSDKESYLGSARSSDSDVEQEPVTVSDACCDCGCYERIKHAAGATYEKYIEARSQLTKTELNAMVQGKLSEAYRGKYLNLDRDDGRLKYGDDSCCVDNQV